MRQNRANRSGNRGVSVAAASVRRQWFGRQELLDSSAEGGDTMRQGQDFGHRIDRYQRYPTRSTSVEATRSPSVFEVSFCCYQRYSASIST